MESHDVHWQLEQDVEDLFAQIVTCKVERDKSVGEAWWLRLQQQEDDWHIRLNLSLLILRISVSI